MTSPELSIIIPAYNEETLITSTLESLESYLSARSEGYEIIVVDDGSQDKTARCIQDWQKINGGNLRLLINEKNKGKGFCIRRGVVDRRSRAFLSYAMFLVKFFPGWYRQCYFQACQIHSADSKVSGPLRQKKFFAV